MHGILANIQGDARQAVGDAPPNHRAVAYFKFVPGSQHFFAGFAGTGAQHGIFACFIHQEQANVIIIKGFFDLFDGLGDQLLGIQQGADAGGHLGGELELARAVFMGVQQALALILSLAALGDFNPKADDLDQLALLIAADQAPRDDARQPLFGGYGHLVIQQIHFFERIEYAFSHLQVFVSWEEDAPEIIADQLAGLIAGHPLASRVDRHRGAVWRQAADHHRGIGEDVLVKVWVEHWVSHGDPL